MEKQLRAAHNINNQSTVPPPYFFLVFPFIYYTYSRMTTLVLIQHFEIILNHFFFQILLKGFDNVKKLVNLFWNTLYFLWFFWTNQKQQVKKLTEQALKSKLE